MIKLVAHGKPMDSANELNTETINTYLHCSSIKAFCVVELHIPVTLQFLYFFAMCSERDPHPHPTSRMLCPSFIFALSQYSSIIATSASSRVLESSGK